MDWLADEYGRLTGTTSPAVTTGKSIANGGSQGRDTATAQGGIDVLMAVLNDAGDELSGKRVAIQGFGNAGANAARLVTAAGATVVAASDSTGIGMMAPARAQQKVCIACFRSECAGGGNRDHGLRRLARKAGTLSVLEGRAQ
jgi:glutamate dehydrogenase/leucine dehydrogenase